MIFKISSLKINQNILNQAKNTLYKELDINIRNNKKILLLLSGGSSLALLDDSLPLLNLDKLTIAPLDERYTKNSFESNTVQIINSSFYKNAERSGAHLIDVQVKKDEKLNEITDRFHNNLLKWIKENPNGVIIATIGIGQDGHIAGIMPYPEDKKGFNDKFYSNNKFVVGYDAGNRNQYPLRITSTMNLISKIDIAIVYAVGSNKKVAIEKTLAKNGSIAETPARILNDLSGKVFLFTDENV